MTTKTKPQRTAVPPPIDERAIPHFIDVPDELEAPAEAVRAAIVRTRQMNYTVAMAGRALEAAGNIDRLAAATAGPATLPAATRPQRQQEYDEAIRGAQAAQDALTFAIRAQSAAIAPVIDEWRAQHEQQVRARVELAAEQLEALVQTLSEIEGDVALDDAMRDYAPGAPSGWHLHYRTPDVLQRQTDKEEARLRKNGGGLLKAHVIQNETAALLAAIRVQADAWALKREAERKAARRAEIEREEAAKHPAGSVALINAVRDRLRAEGLEQQ